MQNGIWAGSKTERKLGIAAAALLLGCSLAFGQGAGEEAFSFSLRGELIKEIQERAGTVYFPVFSFIEEEGGRRKDAAFFTEYFSDWFLLYAYADQRLSLPGQVESAGILEKLMESGGVFEKEREKRQESVPEAADIMEEVRKENENAEKKQSQSQSQDGGFQEAERALTVDLEGLRDFDELISEFYAVDGTTYTGSNELNVDKLLSQDMRLKQTDAKKPQILIYHTHSQEGFADSIAGDETTTILGAGERLAQILRERYGFNVIHHMGKYDVESRDYAYSNAAPALEQILEENPDIEVIIDLHRDEMPEERRLVADIGGRPTAKYMFFNGLSRTGKTGDIAYLANPNLNENLAFSFQMQLISNEYYPGIARKIYLKGYRYNMQYRGKTLLIELGAQNNTVEEIMNACDPLAHVLSIVLRGEDGGAEGKEIEQNGAGEEETEEDGAEERE